MQVTLIPDQHVYNVWSRMYPYMEKAAEYTHGRYSADDILDSITQYDHQLWAAFEDDKIVGVTVTYFKQYPRKKCLDLVFCAGDEGMQWKDPMLKMLQHWAYDNDCDSIEATGRLGWAGIFKNDGYKPMWQIFELPVADRGLGE